MTRRAPEWARGVRPAILAARFAFLGLGVAILVVLFRRVDWVVSAGYLRRLGGAAPLVLAPYAVMLLFDTLGWRATLERPTVSLLRLFRIRAATEAVLSSLPAGAAVAEPLRTVLLQRQFGLSVADATGSVIVSKIAIALAQGAFLVVGVALAQSWTVAEGPAPRPAGPGWFGLAVALGFMGVMGALLAAVVRGRLLTRIHARLGGAGGAGWRARLARFEQPLARVDHAMGLFARAPRKQIAASLTYFFIAWLCLALEDWLILYLLRAPLSFASAIAMEATASVVRIGFFFLPGGLGGQEATYYGLLRLYGVPNAEAIAAAFVIVKRAKEVVWIALGYVLLAYLPARLGEVPEPAPSTP